MKEYWFFAMNDDFISILDLIMFPMFFVLISCDIFIDNHQYPRNGAKKPWKVRNFSQITTKIQTTMAVQRSYISSTWPHRRILCGRSHRRNRCRGWNPCTNTCWSIPFDLRGRIDQGFGFQFPFYWFWTTIPHLFKIQ